MSDIHVVLIVSIVFGIFTILFILFSNPNPYTHQEWEDQCAADFKKYGPVPEDEN